ncbi:MULTISPECIES: ArnT family glycosyltransferase [Streptomyces]|uniref:Glycosyltransferase family 39 protein n=1 Tax=Streptomyces ortus TaxID=2867268 RepID=A0ABT3UUR8_9ACTN|nr:MULTISPECIES: glycosyltransferase family 39 protein [Streptomyces]MCX4231294.1 glycosyltransferase family 39 protein [Streptomyces ortus]
MTAPTTESGTSTVPESDDRLSRIRRPVWRSPADQPPWARPALLGIAALAAALYAWNITESGYASYYSVAARSMTVSWKAFLFTALDPSATITLDKIGGFLWPQALSARVFGFHAWALTLPQCVEGVVSVLVMYRVVRRWQGPAAGLLAAGLLALTPVAASMFGHAMLDGMVVMCLIIAADQYQKAVGTARLRPLLFSGLWIGLGFQAKMMEAWIIVPALFVGYLVAAPVTLRRRAGQLLAAGAVMVAVSLSWVALMTFTPKDARPYVDGTTDNSAFSMVFGYNGFNRFEPGLIDGADDGREAGGDRNAGGDQHPGVAPGGDRNPGAGQAAPPSAAASGQAAPPPGAASGSQGPDSAGRGPGGTAEGSNSATRAPGAPPGGSDSATQGPSAAGGGSNTATRGPGPGPDTGDGEATRQADAAAPGSSSWLKLLRVDLYAAQIGWLYPLALAGLITGLLRHRKGPRTGQARAGYLMWGVWLATTAGVLSSYSFAHTAYLATLAPAIAALSAAGTVALWRAHRGANAGWPRWVLPAVVAAEAAWTIHLASAYTDFAPWLIPLVSVAALAAVLALGLSANGEGTVRVRVGNRRGPRIPVKRAGLAAAGLLAGCVAMFAAPTTWSLSVLDERYAGSAFEAVAGPTAAPGAPDGPEPTSLTAGQRGLLTYVEKHNGGADYTMSVDSWSTAAPYIYEKGLPVLPLRGYSGTARSVTLADYQDLVATGRLRFALLSGVGPATGEPRPKNPPALGKDAPETLKINSWVYSTCTEIAPSTYGGTTSDDGPPQTLFRCA